MNHKRIIYRTKNSMMKFELKIRKIKTYKETILRRREIIIIMMMIIISFSTKKRESEVDLCGI